MSFRFLDFDDLFGDQNVAIALRSKHPYATGNVGKTCRSQQQSTSSWIRMDVADKDDECTVRAELPGVEKEDIHVHYDDATHLLTIEAERHEDKESASTDSSVCFYRECFSGRIKREVVLPDNTDGNACKASLTNGVLRLVFGKKPEQESRKRISIE